MANKYIYNMHIHNHIQCYQLMIKKEILGHKSHAKICYKKLCTNIPEDFTTFSSALVIILKNFTSLGIGSFRAGTYNNLRAELKDNWHQT